MAAGWKKRVAAEYSQTIQENEPPPEPKRLRLEAHPPSSSFLSEPSSSSSSQRPTGHLFNFSEIHTTGSALARLTEIDEGVSRLPDPSTSVSHLLSVFRRRTESAVRSRIAMVIGRICRMHRGVITDHVSELISLIMNEKSHIVKAELLSALKRSAEEILLSNRSALATLVTTLKQILMDPDSRVRCVTLALLGDCVRLDESSNRKCSESMEGQGDLLVTEGSSSSRPSDQPSAGSETMGRVNSIDASTSPTAGILQLILTYCQAAQEPRVRRAAFMSVRRLQKMGLCRGNMVLYRHAAGALNDDYEGVRRAAMPIIWGFCTDSPDTMVTNECSNERMRTVDDGFALLCNCLNDISWQVRQVAMELLGSLHTVSQRFLLQTLDKKLMSNMRRKQTAHERQREHYAAGEWATGQKWASDAPKELVNAEAVTLISMGACGLFVHGLEDEFYEVRLTAVRAMQSLAERHAYFARLSQDFLVDMFNDEIEEVRLEAIASLRAIASNLLLREDQMEVILAVLKESNAEIREMTHHMLCESRLQDRAGALMCIMALIENLKQYPMDQALIWKVMQHIGRRHGELSQFLLPELLCLHPFFDTPEPRLEDPAYVAVLALVMNAAHTTPRILTSLPAHMSLHFDFLRLSQPDLCPPLIQLGSSTEAISGTSPVIVTNLKNGASENGVLIGSLSSNQTQGGSSSSSFLSGISLLLERVSTLETRAQQLSLLQHIHRELREVECREKANDSVTTAFLLKYVNLFRLLIEVKGSLSEPAQCRALANKVLSACLAMKHLFQGETTATGYHNILTEGTFIGATVSHLGDTPTADILSQLGSLRAKVERSGATHTDLGRACLEAVSNVVVGGPALCIPPPRTPTEPLTLPALPGIGQSGGPMTMMSCSILAPGSMRENPLRFTAGLALSLTLKLRLHHIASRWNDLHLQIQVAGRPCEYVSLAHLAADKEQSDLYSGEITLSTGPWSDLSCIEIQVVIRLPDQDNAVVPIGPAVPKKVYVWSQKRLTGGPTT